jgi:FeS assembly SUF system regulator
MLRISKLADYGIVLLGHLALEPDASWTARQLADKSGLPLPTVSKLLKKLSRGGLLTSERGSTGGYRLSRGPAETTVAEVIGVLDGPVSLTECALGRCEIESCCPMRSSWKRINDAVRGALAGLTIADLLARSTDRPGPRRADVIPLRAR